MPAEEVWGRVVSMAEGCLAGGAVLGPGALADDIPATVQAAGSATWMVVVVVLVVVVVSKEGPPCGNARQDPGARSCRYLRAIFRYTTCSMCWYLIARR
ncbi:hypothetical protein NDU88_007222 [Pleurodeles waltl]|uniref:Uncharacterized protein n=1 Tax=Pleurodeles waltl TaxID=8319 RepID=A0AAV7UPV1_PLEWA|nr:hypothetical protein NDU88_007222 [Pleurodeles waltl]